MSPTGRPLLALALVAAALAAGCGDDPRAGRPSALLVTLDTTRWDALGVTGAPPGTTPRLDALAEEATLYSAARTVAPLTLPAHASILTGLYPPRHGLRLNGVGALPPAAVTLAERARERGYATGAFVAAVVLDAEFGLDQGFEVYRGPEAPEVTRSTHYVDRPADEVAADTIAWLRGLEAERPFFAWVHLFDPHHPHEPPPDLLARKLDPYHAEVAAADRAVGRILDALEAEGRLDETVVVVVADHGEGRGEHGESTHATLLYESTVRVPLLVRWPDGRGAGERSDAVVSVVDVYPTLVEALGLGAPGDVDGESLLRPAPDRGVYFETFYGWGHYGWSPLAGWADREGKYLHSSEPELYDVRADPAESRNLVAEADAARLGRYRAAIAAVAERPRLDAAPGDGPEGFGDELRALGYAGSGAVEDEVPHPLEPTGLPSPRARQPAFEAFLRAQQLREHGREEEAERVLARLVEENPGNRTAWFQLGSVRIVLGRHEEAVDALERAIAEGFSGYEPHFNLAIAHEHLGQTAPALEHYLRAVEHRPHLVEALERIVALQEQAGADPGELARWRVRLIEARER